MEIVYKSIGCFHNISYTFLFKHNFVDIFDNNSMDIEQIKMGRLYLSKKDIIGLDNLLQFYSKKNWTECTTINIVCIKILVGFVVVHKFIFSDSSGCLHEQSDVLTFDSLLERLNGKSN